MGKRHDLGASNAVSRRQLFSVDMPGRRNFADLSAIVYRLEGKSACRDVAGDGVD
jgi:hypothetical protein